MDIHIINSSKLCYLTSLLIFVLIANDICDTSGAAAELFSLNERGGGAGGGG